MSDAIEEEGEYDLELEKVAQRILAPRAHSLSELRNKLRKRDYEVSRIENLLEIYIKRKWLDDEDFANRQAELLAEKAWGKNQIRKKLMKRGVASFHIEGAISKLNIEWFEIAKARVHKKFPFPKNVEAQKKQKEKAFRHLVTRGFSQEIARRVVFFQD